ncbi:MAG: Alkyl hydroperoxide reductase/ Thiol specific antioxidant/ Mal allergen [Candidatus Roizmanbacteria bacterium GW2011_GWA2_34_18]|uniref:Alkyl hydroperoxide reductase/ Thiol specific antioxidant/ Mal allergen n=1 Tax=Candidatus Roizmanbacteria bacterium GW2011_GWA2_34_18 TaxID=1618477 RepID=A0A0G0B7I4_9BACT|nr:MAG: Alkyl hydroperoxide reductase/ Thiol specific antioxidant/ Mal allergen [Candidatus Roizmanbacteria bacterium GW2011_GWA2_34_18]
MKDITDTDQAVFTVSKDKILTYVLIILIIATVVVGYSVASSKNQVKADNKQVAAVDPMADHHGGGGGASNKKFEPLAPGTVAPDFSLPSTAGRTISLSDYKGKNIFLFFNEGVMCAPCWQEVSKLERFKQEFDNLNTVIIPISVDDQKTWDPILKEEKITTPILIDADRKVTKAYKALGTPSSMHDDRAGHTYIHITPDGKVHSSADFSNMNVPTNLLLSHISQLQNQKNNP